MFLVGGHDLDALHLALERAQASARPNLIACRTIIAKGLERLQGQRGGHSAKLFRQPQWLQQDTSRSAAGIDPQQCLMVVSCFLEDKKGIKLKPDFTL